MNKNIWAFVDESGNPSLALEKPGTSKYYVLSGLVIPEDNIEDFRTNAQDIALRHFNGSEIKSSGIGKNIQRRKEVLRDFVSTGIRFYALVVDKNLIFEDSGLKFKRSFFKYLNQLFYRKLHRTMENLSVRADEHGRSEFMQGFKTYLKDKYASELFEVLDFKFVESRTEPLVGLADLVAGTIRRVYEGSDSKDLLEILKPSTILIDHWPPSALEKPIIGDSTEEEIYDDLVSRQGMLSARNFIEQNYTTGDPEVELQISTLKYLIYRFEILPSEYVSTGVILDHLNEISEEEVVEHRFRSRIIAILRNKGVIIASSSKGYKIPNSTKDIADFVELVNTQTIPYLNRLGSVRDDLRLASLGEYEIVSEEKYTELHGVLNSLKTNSSNQSLEVTQLADARSAPQL